MPLLNADLRDVRDEDMGGGGWKAFEPGEYVFHIVESDYRRTSKGNGMVLELVYECLEPGRRGKVFDYLTLEHPNAETVRIARAQLKETALAVGHPSPDFIRASEELHRKPLVLGLKKEKADRGGDVNGMRNVVFSRKPMPARSPAASAPPYTPAQAPAPRDTRGDFEPPPLGDDEIPF